MPEGATPKDGPSAGVAMATVIVSMLTGIPVRRDIAMTGEITLRGRVLPIGGLKEKLLAALRGGIKKVLIPEDNVKDLAEIPNSVKNGPRDRAGLADGGGAEARARAPADADRLGGGRQRGGRRLPPAEEPGRASSPTEARVGLEPSTFRKAPRIRRDSRRFCLRRPDFLRKSHRFFAPLPANPCVFWAKREQ